MPTYRILIVDDSDTFRVAAEALLASDERFEVVGRAASGREGLAEAARLRPALVLMDLSMSDMDGLEATLRLARLPDAPPVVIMTSHDQPEYREAAEKAGAAGFLVKSELDAGLLTLVLSLLSP